MVKASTMIAASTVVVAAMNRFLRLFFQTISEFLTTINSFMHRRRVNQTAMAIIKAQFSDANVTRVVGLSSYKT